MSVMIAEIGDDGSADASEAWENPTVGTQDISRVFGAKAEAPMEQSAAAAVFLSPKGRVLFDCLM